jgi:hypothetical protein
MELTKDFVKNCRKTGVLQDFLCQAIDQVDAKDKEIAELKEAQRWRKFSDEKPADKQWILVYYPNHSNFTTGVEMRRWDNGCKFDVYVQEMYTKWMPSPEKPKE